MHAEIAEMDKTSKQKQTDRMGWNDASLFLSNHSSALPPVSACERNCISHIHSSHSSRNFLISSSSSPEFCWGSAEACAEGAAPDAGAADAALVTGGAVVTGEGIGAGGLQRSVWGLRVTAAWSFWPSGPVIFSLTISSSIFFKRRRLRALKLSISNTPTLSGPSGSKLKAFPTIATWRAKSPRRTSEIYSPEDFQGWNPEKMFKRRNPLTLYPVTMVFRFRFVFVQRGKKWFPRFTTPSDLSFCEVFHQFLQLAVRYFVLVAQLPRHDCTRQKGRPYVHITKQFQHPRFHRTLDEIHSCQTFPLLSDWIQRTWDHELGKLRKRKKTVLTTHERFLTGLRFLCSGNSFTSSTHATSWLLATSHSAGITPTQPEPKQWRYVKTYLAGISWYRSVCIAL